MRTSILLTGLIAFSSSGQQPMLHPLNESNGLPSNNVYDLFVEHDGALWISCERGLYRYDGFGYERIASPAELGHELAVEMQQFANGDVYVATTNFGLFRWRNGAWHGFRPTGSPLPTYRIGHWADIIDLGEGSILLTTDQGTGSWVLDAATERIQVRRDSSSFQAVFHTVMDQCVMEFGGPQRMTTNADTLALLDGDRLNERLLSITMSDMPRLVRGGPIVKDRTGGKWITLANLLLRVGADGNLAKRRFPTRVEGGTMDSHGRMWFRLFMDRAICLDTLMNELPLSIPQLNGMHVTAQVMDRQGGTWFSTFGLGLFYCPSFDVLNYPAGAAFATARITALHPDGDGGVYVGTHNSMVHHVDGDGIVRRSDRLLRSPANGDVKGMVTDHSGRVLAGAVDAAYVVGEQGAKALPFERHAAYFYDAWQHPDGHWLCATLYGLCRSNTADNVSVPLSLEGKRCYAIEPGEGDTLWVSTTEGLFAVDHHGAPLQNEAVYFGGLTVTNTKALGDTLFIGTAEGLWRRSKVGLVMLAPPGATEPLDVTSLWVDHPDTIWIGTHTGIYRLCTAQKEASWTHYGKGAGLPNEAIRDLVLSGHRLWAIAGNDLVVFDPARTNASQVHTPFLPSTVLIGPRALPLSDNMPFEYTTSGWAIQLRNINFARFHHPAFRFRLNADSAWTLLDQPRIELFGLAPGAYTMDVEAAGSDGTWGRTQQLTWTVVPRLWQTSGFKALLFVVLGGCIMAFFWWLRARGRREQDLRNAALMYQHKALLAQLEPHFVFNALNSIQGFIANHDSASSNRYLARFAKLMRGLLDASERDSIPLLEEVELLEHYCSLEAIRFEPSFTYSITVDPALNGDRILLPAFLLQPYVENAIRHGLRGLAGVRPGVLEIAFAAEATDAFVCVITDNGVGRAAADQQHGSSVARTHGTLINADRMELLNKKYATNAFRVHIVDLMDADGRPCGTRVEVRAPRRQMLENP